MSEKVNKAFRTLIRKNIPLQVIAGKVTKVNEGEFTIDVNPSDGGAPFVDVRLRSVIDEESLGFIVVPEVEANVLIGLIHNNENANYLISADLIRRILITAASGSKIECKSNGDIEINDGENGGLTITPTLQQELAKTNAIVKKIMDALTQWMPVSGDGGAALKTRATQLLSGQQLGDFSQIENTKVKH